MSAADRRTASRRKLDIALGSLAFGWFGRALSRSTRFAYVSYLPDAIREFASVPDYSRHLETWTHENARNNAGDLPRLLALILNVTQVLDEEVPGDFAELGVYKGNSAKLLADILRDRASDRKLFLFDTFGGFDARDLVGVDARAPVLFSDSSLARVQAFVGSDSICEYRVGYFPETTSGLSTDVTFAVVHLDCDLYEPTVAALEYFYPRLSPGAIVLIHDYSSRHWPGIPKALTEFLASKPERLVLLPDKSGTAVMRKL
jgi:hypothetical protein